MPPRITRKSYRPRASDRTMVDNVQPRRLSCFRIRKRRHDNRMDLRKKRTPRASQHYVGWRAWQKSLLLPVAGEVFLLTLPFIDSILVRISRPHLAWKCSQLLAYGVAGVRRHSLDSSCALFNLSLATGLWPKNYFASSFWQVSA